MNELSMIFDKLNIPTKDVLEASSTKWNFLNFKPGLDSGMFYEKGTFFPKLLQLDITFKPLHQGVSGFLQGSAGFLRTVENAELQLGSAPSGAPPNPADTGVVVEEKQVAQNVAEGQLGLT